MEIAQNYTEVHIADDEIGVEGDQNLSVCANYVNQQTGEIGSDDREKKFHCHDLGRQKELFHQKPPRGKARSCNFTASVMRKIITKTTSSPWNPEVVTVANPQQKFEANSHFLNFFMEGEFISTPSALPKKKTYRRQ